MIGKTPTNQGMYCNKLGLFLIIARTIRKDKNQTERRKKKKKAYVTYYLQKFNTKRKPFQLLSTSLCHKQQKA